MHPDEQERIANNNHPAPEAPKRRRGRPAVSKETKTLEVNVSGITAARLEKLAEHANQRIAGLGIVASCDAGKMLDQWVEQMVNEKYREAFPKAFTGKK